jgi:hypothetical protein
MGESGEPTARLTSDHSLERATLLGVRVYYRPPTMTKEQRIARAIFFFFCSNKSPCGHPADPHYFGKLDPDQKYSEKLDPDPH